MVSLFGKFPRKISIFQEKMKVLVTIYGIVYLVSKRMIFKLRRMEIIFVTYSLVLSHWFTSLLAQLVYKLPNERDRF